MVRICRVMWSTIGVGFFVPLAAFAAPRDIPLQISILSQQKVQDLAQYIGLVYQYLTGIAGIFAVAMIMYGGMKWIFAAGDTGKIGAAKETINHAVIGLILALGSYLILNTINPNLVRLRYPRIDEIVENRLRQLGCYDYKEQETCEQFNCWWVDTGEGTCYPKAGDVGMVGGACENGRCLTGLSCVRARGQDLCTDRQEGSPCGSDDDCIAGLRCSDLTANCFLSSRRPLAESCSQNEECVSNFCYGGRCTTPEALAQVCLSSDDCEYINANSFCPWAAYDSSFIREHPSPDWRRCQAKQSAGKPCCSNEECINGDCEGGSLIGCSELGRCN